MMLLGLIKLSIKTSNIDMYCENIWNSWQEMCYKTFNSLEIPILKWCKQYICLISELSLASVLLHLLTPSCVNTSYFYFTSYFSHNCKCNPKACYDWIDRCIFRNQTICHGNIFKTPHWNYAIITNELIL